MREPPPPTTRAVRLGPPTTEPAPPSLVVLAVLAAIKLAVHLALLGRYGIHGDEMYFLACGRRLDLGYVDHPPLVPWIARLTEVLLGDSVAAVRIAPALAGALLVAITVLVCAELGGRGWAQLVAGLCVLIAPVYLRAQSLLSLPAFEPLFWTAASLFVLVALRQGEASDRAGTNGRVWMWWVGAGVVAGVGLLNKHTMAVWGIGVAAGLLLSSTRRWLATRGPWLGAAVAFLIFLPNLVWQARHEWATVQFLSAIRDSVLGEIPRLLFLLGQLAYQHPLTLPIWLLGLAWALWGPPPVRILSWIYLSGFVAFAVTQGKPYYLAPAYPALYAAGAVALEARLRRGWMRRAVPGALVVGGLLTGLIALPVLPLERADALLAPVVRPVLEDPADLTGEFHEQMGFEAYADLVDRYVERLSPRERESLVLLARSYALAGVLQRFSHIARERPVISGHLTWWLWGPGDATDELVVTVGLEPGEMTSWCPSPESVSRPTLTVARNAGTTLAVCRGSGRPISTFWHRLRRYDHGPP